MDKMFESRIVHHETRAAIWLARGKADFAKGSMRKAAKWRDKARAFDLMAHGAYPKTRLGMLVDEALTRVAQRLSNDVEAALFNG